MLNRLFFYVSSDDMNNYRNAFPSLKYNFIPRTLLIHQVVNISGNNKAIYYRNGSCGCSCLRSSFKECESLDQFKEYSKFIKMTTLTHSQTNDKSRKRKFHLKKSMIVISMKRRNGVIVETEASKYIQEGDIAVIKTGDDHAYYLLKLTSSVFHTEDEVTDDYWHIFSPAHRVVE